MKNISLILIEGRVESWRIASVLKGKKIYLKESADTNGRGNTAIIYNKILSNEPYLVELAEMTIGSLFDQEDSLIELKEKYNLRIRLFIRPDLTCEVAPSIMLSEKIIGFCVRTGCEPVIDIEYDDNISPEDNQNECHTYFRVSGTMNVNHLLSRIDFNSVESYEFGNENDFPPDVCLDKTIRCNSVDSEINGFVYPQMLRVIRPLADQIDELIEMKKKYDLYYSLTCVPTIVDNAFIDLSPKPSVMRFCHKIGATIVYDIYRDDTSFGEKEMQEYEEELKRLDEHNGEIIFVEEEPLEIYYTEFWDDDDYECNGKDNTDSDDIDNDDK